MQAALESRDAQLRMVMCVLDQVHKAASSRMEEHQQTMLALGTSMMRAQQHAALLERRAHAAEKEVNVLKATLKHLTAEADRQSFVQRRTAQAAQAEAAVANAKLQLIWSAVGGVDHTGQDAQHVGIKVWVADQPTPVYMVLVVQEITSQDDSPKHTGLPLHLRPLLLPKAT